MYLYQKIQFGCVRLTVNQVRQGKDLVTNLYYRKAVKEKDNKKTEKKSSNASKDGDDVWVHER